ncbi:MAG: sulfurtransferase complex subunit TusD [Enterobacterales bacterium]
MKLKYCLIINHSPYNNQKSYIAFQFATALINCGHYINSIFLYQDGVCNIANITLPNDEINLFNKWQILLNKYKVPMYVCINSIERRGIIQNIKNNLKISLYNGYHKFGFKITGLIDLAKSIAKSDRCIQF